VSEKETKHRAGQKIATDKRREFTIEERQTKALELWLVRKKPYSEIATILGISKGQVGNDVNAAIAKAADDLKLELAVNVRKEFGEQLKFAKRVRDAAEKWLLIDDEISLDPRSTEVMVIYDDLNDRNQKGEPKQKREKL
jgi:DNA-binding CsgD family transcriptional regulator